VSKKVRGALEERPKNIGVPKKGHGMQTAKRVYRSLRRGLSKAVKSKPWGGSQARGISCFFNCEREKKVALVEKERRRIDEKKKIEKTLGR